MRRLPEWFPSHWVAHRDLLGSDIMIVFTIFLHLIKGISFLTTSYSDWPIGMHALLSSAHYNQTFAGCVLIGACALAAIGEWGNGMIVPGLRAILLMGQLLVLCIPAWGVIIAVVSGQYPCASPECLAPLKMTRIGILNDQLPRLLWAGAYGVCAWVRIRHK